VRELDGESGELTEREEVVGAGTGKSETEYWNEVDGENLGINSRDKGRHIERNDQSCVTNI